MRCFYYLIVSCLFMAHISAEKVRSSTHSNRLLNLQSKLRKIQDDVTSAAADIQANSGNKDPITFKLSAIEGDFQGLNEELSNIISKSASRSSKNSPSKPKKNKKYRLTLEIVADIREQRFESAAENIRKINNLDEVAKIFQAVYGSNLNNFDLVANFIESLTDIDLIYVSVNALRREMFENDHNNPFNWIRLAKILETRFIGQSDVDYFMVQFGQFTYDALKDSLRAFTLDALKTALSKGTFERNGEMDNLTSAIYTYDPLQWESIIYEFVNSNTEDMSKVLDIITSHRFIEQRVSGVSVLYWSMKFNHIPKSDVIINIASLLREFQSDSEYEKLDPSLKDLVDKIIENLPTCARNLFFLPSICLWNQGTESNLVVLNSSFNYDSKRRHIFSSDLLPGSHWYVNKKQDNYFVISSGAYENEVLYSANTKYNPNLRYVFNRISGNNKEIEERSKWIIEFDNDDFCYLKNAKYNEYLIASDQFMGENLRHVFTWVPENFSKEPQFQWQIRSCN